MKVPALKPVAENHTYSSGCIRKYPDYPGKFVNNTTMEEEKRKCSHCGSGFTGRIDKKFCSDQCRAMTNNRQRLEDKGEQSMRQINRILRQNRNLLQRKSPDGKTTLRREVLQQAGFDFRYFTHLYRTQKGSTYHFCYDYGYLLLPDEKVLIVNWQQYMGKG